MAFPTLSLNPTTISEELFDPIDRNDFESGTVQVAKKFTREKRRFALTYKMMPQSDRASLETHFLATQGTSDTWTHPISSTVYTVIYSESSLKFNYVGYDGQAYWQVTFMIEEF